MLTIQELGLSIMSDNPKPFYFVGGPEYGIKDKYMDKLVQLYGSKTEYPSVSEVIDLFKVKHFIPLSPTLYVVRYDESFPAALNEKLAKTIRSLKVIGTVFCIYENNYIDKIDRFLPEFTAIVDTVNLKYVEKYLHSDFPKLDDRSIRVAAQCSSSYGHARTICKSMRNADPTLLAKMPEKDLAKLFGCADTATEEEIKIAIAARNFKNGISLIEKYEGDYDTLIYAFLQTMIDMEKILTTKYSDSPIKDYARLWKLQDVYYGFMNAYGELSKLRSNTSTDAKSSLIYLFGLLTFKDIPSEEVMNSDI